MCFTPTPLPTVSAFALSWRISRVLSREGLRGDHPNDNDDYHSGQRILTVYYLLGTGLRAL